MSEHSGSHQPTDGTVRWNGADSELSTRVDLGFDIGEQLYSIQRPRHSHTPQYRPTLKSDQWGHPS